VGRVQHAAEFYETLSRAIEATPPTKRPREFVRADTTYFLLHLKVEKRTLPAKAVGGSNDQGTPLTLAGDPANPLE
jgi:hypothetical protein